jgi:Ran GTPase-activating protein (RanGAP) involved in mRNA processing and transport
MVRSNKEINNYILYRSISIIACNLFKNLKSLDLQKCNIGSKGVLILQIFFKRSEFLFNLNLAYNNLGDDGLKYFSDTMRRNKSIQTINLECNGITDEGFVHFIYVVITHHQTMKAIKLALNQITNEGLKHLTIALEDNANFSFALIDMKYNNILNDDISEQKSLEKQRIFI